MLACLLLAGMLGGIAMANPDALRGSLDAPPAYGRGGASHDHPSNPDDPESGDDPSGDDDSDGSGRTSHEIAECRATVGHLEGDLASGDHGGLTQAIEIVERNCSDHTQAPGLLRALERLAANHERWVERHDGDNGSAGDPPGQGQDKEKPEKPHDHGPSGSGSDSTEPPSSHGGNTGGNGNGSGGGNGNGPGGGSGNGNGNA
jgi:hypothetical protein